MLFIVFHIDLTSGKVTPDIIRMAKVYLTGDSGRPYGTSNWPLGANFVAGRTVFQKIELEKVMVLIFHDF
jgi:hypothetical protein